MIKRGEPVIILDYKDRRPIYEQIVERLKELIIKGVLNSESQLPSVRNLAMDLSINPNTIQRAYAELERQGFIYSVKGKGSFVSFNDQMLLEKREEIFNTIGKLIQEAKVAGITETQFIQKVSECFKEDKSND